MAAVNEPWAFLHRQFVPQAEAHLTLHDAGFVMGACVTDLCRTFRHRPFRLPDHLARFLHSSTAAHLELPYSEAQIAVHAEELLARNCRLIDAADDLALVLFATPGPIGFYLGESGGAGDTAPTFGMHTFPLPFARYRRLVGEGASLVVPTVRQAPRECVDPHIKQRSRLHWWVADREAQRLQPGSAALLLDMNGHVTETASANFLIVRRGTVLSPPRENILEGVSLSVVRELCGELHIPFVEQTLSLDDCLAADEAMLCCTSYCLAGVSRLQGKPLCFPGPLFARILQAWSERVGVDIHGQICPTDNAT